MKRYLVKCYMLLWRGYFRLKSEIIKRLNNIQGEGVIYSRGKLNIKNKGTFILKGISLPIEFNKSCIAPKEQINPQKNLPQTTVMRNTPSISTNLPKLSSRTKLPSAIDDMIYPIDENMVINRAGTVMKAIS